MTTLLKPGYLISLKTVIDGGVQYARKDLPSEETATDGADVARWETVRKIDDPDEHKRAVKARGAAASLIRSVCVHTAFGLLCPESRGAELDEAIRSAQAVVDTHNAAAHATLVRIYVLRGRIASSDEEAVRGIAAELRGELEAMQDGIRRVDVEAIREAAKRARQLGAILDEDQAKKVSAAVEAARLAAKLIVKQIETQGAEATRAAAIGMAGPIESARFAFLELEESAQTPVPVAAPVARGELEIH